MKIGLSVKDRAVLVSIVNAAPSWGGDEASLLVRDEMYRLLELSWFEDRELTFDLCCVVEEEYEASREVVQHIIATLTTARLARPFGRVAAAIVRRLRAALEERPLASVSHLEAVPSAEPGAG